MTFKPCINAKNLKNDILSGIIVAFVSIPIAMGYAQISGLPAVYGLYGSLFPVLIYGLLASSPQFVVGVDAMPAAMIGSSLATLGIVSGTDAALQIVPSISLMVGVWFVVFRILKAGRVVKYISNPVMGGFISGVGFTIILMQVPKLFGGNPSTGEVVQLVANIIREIPNFNLLSFLLGLGTVVVILVSKKFLPKFPMSIVMLGVGMVLTAVFKIDQYGVKLLSAVEGGFPHFYVPDVLLLGNHFLDYFILSLTISLVIMAQTLLASNSYASKYDYEINNDQELVAYAAMNITAGLTGSCPINGSVSRSAIADQFSCKSQVMSITAFMTMLIVTLFCTRFFVYLPVPILTGIVMGALIGILDIKQAKRLWKCNKPEFLIFAMAFLGVLFFGTIYGVMIGVILSFMSVVKKAVVPPRAFLGKIPGHHGYYDLKRNKSSRPIQNTVLYRFGGNLFFANIGTFVNDIEEAVAEDTKFVIVDASGVGNVDITAVDKLIALYEKLSKKGIQFYLAEQQGHVNDLIRQYGGDRLIEEGKVRRTLSLALRACGFEKPYPLEGLTEGTNYSYVESSEKLAEFEWAFGKDAEAKMEQLANEIVENISSYAASTDAAQIEKIDLAEVEEKISWGKIGLFDEEELLEHLEIKLEQLVSNGKLSMEQLKALEKLIEHRKEVVEEKVNLLNPKAIELLHRRMEIVESHLKKISPKEFEHIKAFKENLRQKIRKN
ncbi:SulP family inorganic anion transporter [Treponema sp.]|uniref:SulP family inorganic anion transporter n=1 Tax=Treponema sp. TaxID=166 RepID=UPI00298E29E7|nr:SulP family inorganic anion transporter [Treponema sp.]MCQ2241661.1 SulP family inorganic anion transporter [Treponema sp.]